MACKIFYISSNTFDRSECERLSKLYSKGEFLGKGAYGTVNDVCKRGTNNCNYILKTIIYDKEKYELSGVDLLSEDSVKGQWINEIRTLNKLNRCQVQYETRFVPIMYDAWFCKEEDKTYFYIVMERFDGNLNDLIKLYHGKDLLYPFLFSALTTLTLQLRIIHRDCNVCLNDIKLDNILYKKISKYDFIFVFADTGKSTEEITDKCKKYDTDKFILSIQEFKDKINK